MNSIITAEEKSEDGFLFCNEGGPAKTVTLVVR